MTSWTTVGTLGSELTFAGQATAALLAQRGDDRPPIYFPTMDDVAGAVRDGTVQVGVLTSETSHTASTETVARILSLEPLFIAAEIVVPYHCALLGKPGTRLEDVRYVGGHGSIKQCRPFLAEKLPHAEVRQHRQNSVVAAREILAGDGSMAVIGTLALGRALGLHVIEPDVDRGSVGGWWALTAELPDPDPDARIVAVRVEGSDELQRVLTVAAESGLRIRSVTNAPTGELFRYRYLLTLHALDDAPLTGDLVAALEPGVVGAFPSNILEES
ncbi:prephenate dehydratase domain-containing protein [Cryptosporangium sp. NPDC048952]|uniref:prephenate dehydratase domain-containing protein n=1 Tax=Cryptosporangium sp. NPDC048952 TaxID=3363961 RepID=UPI00371B4AB3